MSGPKLKLTYWDMPGGRGEPARLAMVVAGLEFEDQRVDFSEWPALRPAAPYHAVPTLEVDGVTIGQSNTITRYLGRLAKLYPEDTWQAALCDEMLDVVEEMWVRFGMTMGIKDPEAFKAAREKLASDTYRHYLTTMGRRLDEAGGQYFADKRLTVADLQVMVFCRALGSGKFDHIPTDIVKTTAPQLHEHMKRVLAEPAITAYYEKVFSKK